MATLEAELRPAPLSARRITGDSRGPTLQIDSLDYYLQTALNTPPLSPEQELKMAMEIEVAREKSQSSVKPATRAKWTQRWIDLRTEFLEANLRFVVSYAKKFRGSLEFLDLIQEGNTGLIEALDTFDWRRGARFATHAKWKMKDRITKAIKDDNSLKVSRREKERLRVMKNAEIALNQNLGRRPEDIEIAAYMGLTVEEVRGLKTTRMRIRTITLTISDEDGEEKEREIIDDDDLIERQVDRVALAQVLDLFDERERKMIEYRFGLKDGSRHSHEEIGRLFGVTGESIRQREKKVLDTMRLVLSRR